MPLKFYLHRTTTTDTGTLPAATATTSANSPAIAPSGLTNMAMDGIIGASAQTSIAWSTAATTTSQSSPHLRFVSAPLAAQTIGQQTLALAIGGSCSNTTSAFTAAVTCCVWRPGTGAVVGRFFDSIASVSASAGTSQTNLTISIASGSTTAVTAAANDILVIEIWRSAGVQSMGTSYTNTLFYDGTTENSTSNDAATITFGTNIVLAADQSVTGPNTKTQAVSTATLTVTTPLGQAIPLVDTLNTTTLNATNWATWGPGTQQPTNYGYNYWPLASQSAGSYGGLVGNTTFDLTGKYAAIYFQTNLTQTLGVVSTFQCQIDGSNYLEIGLIDTWLAARYCIAGTVTTVAQIAYPVSGYGPLWVNIQEANGIITYRYATNAFAPNWVILAQVANPIAVTALKVNLVAGTYQSVASVGSVVWNSLNSVILPDPRNANPATFQGQATA